MLNAFLTIHPNNTLTAADLPPPIPIAKERLPVGK
jgi:hypothetical protein